MSRIDETIQAKKEKRQALEEKGVLPHPYSFDKKQTLSQVKQLGEGAKVKTAGRIRSKREHGKVVFLDLSDSSDSVQLMIREQEVGAKQFELMDLIDAGDFLGVEGETLVTRTGEFSIKVKAFEFLGKALRPVPSEWNAIEDKEARYRQRYLDILVNPEVKKVLDARWKIEQELRRYLQDQHDFIEVETPVLQALYGGTNAKPFETHMNALDTDFYLRIAPELYLKRLIVGGYEKIFEIARNFRNEGIDQTHQPEFTMIEWYEAYADYHKMMDTAEGMIKHLAQQVNHSLEISVGEEKIDLTGDWPRITMKEAVKEYLHLDWDQLSDQEIQAVMSENTIELTGVYTRGKALFAVFDKLVPDFLIEPIWIIDYPRDVSPLAKKHRSDADLAERFECYIGGKEIADGWSELVDPVDQRQIFENEQRRMRSGDDEAHPLDEDFIKAMEYGMPPLGGIGIGIDRLVMFLTNTWSIREVIAFPTLKPLDQSLSDHSLQTEQPQESVEAKDSESQAKVQDSTIRQMGTITPSLPPRDKAQALLEEYIADENLRRHCRMVATATEAYASRLDQDQELWYQTGLLHDLDWEKYPDEHPNRAVEEILVGYPQEMLEAIRAHAPHITGQEPETLLERYLFATDELSGFLNAYALMRPTGFSGMKASKVKKKLKDQHFAANVSRDDIKQGFELINDDASEHIQFLIKVFEEKFNEEN